jgi:hypothetical protein
LVDTLLQADLLKLSAKALRTGLVFTTSNIQQILFFLSPVCGEDPLAVTSGCCVASLDLPMSLGIRSCIFDTIELIETFDETNLPKSSNGASYCHLNSTGFGLGSGRVAEYYLQMVFATMELFAIYLVI